MSVIIMNCMHFINKKIELLMTRFLSNFHEIDLLLTITRNHKNMKNHHILIFTGLMHELICFISKRSCQILTAFFYKMGNTSWTYSTIQIRFQLDYWMGEVSQHKPFKNIMENRNTSNANLHFWNC